MSYGMIVSDRTLLARVNEVEGVMYRQSRELGRLNSEVKRYKNENAKLRELACDVSKAAHMLCEAWEGSCDKEADGMSLHAVCPIGDMDELCVFGKLHDRMRELGIEVK